MPGQLSRNVRDRELEIRVIDALTERDIPSLRQLQIEARGGMVFLGGHVHSYYEKELSAHCAQSVLGVVHVLDDVQVVPKPKFSRPALPRRRVHISGTYSGPNCALEPSRRRGAPDGA